jgi:hypothetical protein
MGMAVLLRSAANPTCKSIEYALTTTDASLGLAWVLSILVLDVPQQPAKAAYLGEAIVGLRVPKTELEAGDTQETPCGSLLFG